jgi:AhpD family alkylhydroperoxidase
MAHNPAYLESNWNRGKTIMVQEGQLNRMTKEIIALTVSAMSGCEYCLWVHTSAVQNLGLDDEGILK